MKKQSPSSSEKPKMPSPKATRDSMAGKRHKHDVDRVHDDAHAARQPNADTDDCINILKNDEEIPVKNPG